MDAAVERTGMYSQRTCFQGVTSLTARPRREYAFTLVGAIGGLLSKLRGAVNRANVPFDYGVSWTTLFLAPLVGALTGWAGVLLATALVEVSVFSKEFFDIDWMNASAEPEALALAVVFGFSAALFEAVVDKAQGGVERRVEKSPASAPPVREAAQPASLS